METKEVLILGAGIEGCLAALALVKKGVPVTLVTSSLDQRDYHEPFLKKDQIEERVLTIKKNALGQSVSCPQAIEQFDQWAKKSLEELGFNDLSEQQSVKEIHSSLLTQLRQMDQVEWLSNHSPLELLTLEEHSSKKSDIYKRATCLGAYLYNHETHQVEKVLAKETILATGSDISLFAYSTHAPLMRAGGLAMAHRAQARLLSTGQVQFHPVTLLIEGHSCFPLPLELVKEGKLFIGKQPDSPLVEEHPLTADDFYHQLIEKKAKQGWLDLRNLDPLVLKNQFSSIEEYCLSHGLNPLTDLLPVAPAAQYFYSGVVVDRTSQTTVQRLRAIGEVACNGLFYTCKDEASTVLENMVWAIVCAEEIHKHISKFIYYFPETKNWEPSLGSVTTISEDWELLRHIMWYYLGIAKNPSRMKKGGELLKQLQVQVREELAVQFSIEKHFLLNALQTTQLVS